VRTRFGNSVTTTSGGRSSTCLKAVGGWSKSLGKLGRRRDCRLPTSREGQPGLEQTGAQVGEDPRSAKAAPSPSGLAIWASPGPSKRVVPRLPLCPHQSRQRIENIDCVLVSRSQRVSTFRQHVSQIRRVWAAVPVQVVQQLRRCREVF
jgi:hypothetical protein